jgi:branched-chain amino acid transport system substrate-binding protein
MSTLLKYVMYAIFLALVPAIYLYLYGPPSLVDIASVPGKPKEAAAPVAPVAVASIDEERDYRVARRLGSPEGWRAFLAAHGSGVYTLSARAEIERLLPGEKAPAPAAAGVSNGASPDAKAVSLAARPGPPSPGTEAAALTADEVCKRDGDRLARLRSNPSGDEAARFANELGCEKLRPQLLGLIENLGDGVPPPAEAKVSNGASPDAKAVSEATRAAPPSPGPDVANAPSVVAANAAAPPPAQTSAHNNAVRGVSDKDILFRMAAPFSGASGMRAEVQRLFSEEKTRAPAGAEVSNGASPDAKAVSEAVRPGPPSPGTEVANASSVVAANAAAQPPAQTSAPDNAVRGVSDKEILFGMAAAFSGASGMRAEVERLFPVEKAPPPAEAKVSNGASPDAKAVSEATRAAPPSPGPDVANASSVVAANAAAPPPAQTSAPDNAVRGVSDKELSFGMAAPLSGASRELGRQMQIGVETAFNHINSAGGVNGRLLRLVAADDGYEPEKTADAMHLLYDKDQVFGFIGNVGTPTAAVALPFALDHRALFFGAFTGASLLRRDPPDRYVFNYRASYAEETDAVVRYLVKVRRIQPKEIVVFAQQDLYGDSGYAGVQKAVRSLPGENPDIVRLNYKRNTIDVQGAVDWLRGYKGQIKAVVMVASYRAAAKFIEKTRDLYPSMIYTNVSFVGSTALTDELMLLGPRYATGVVVTQVVPAINSYASIVLKYKEALAKYFPGEPADYVSFEGYIDANILSEAVKRVGRDINTEKLVDELERMHDFDLGLGTPVTFSSNEHQGSHKVWGTQLDETGHYQPIDLR